MKSLIISIILLITINTLFSQNVGINSTGAAPNASAILDVASANKGFLIPHVSLNSTTDITTISSPAVGLLVYNVNPFIVGVGANGEGFYYYDGTKWFKFLEYKSAGPAWLTTGNDNTVDGTNFIGTTDLVPLNFRVFNKNAGRIDPFNQNVFLGTLAGGSNSSQYNTAIGDGALKINTYSKYNTAIGFQALSQNIVDENTAIGSMALSKNDIGMFNTATGTSSLLNNSSGSNNTANGYNSLLYNLIGNHNTSSGFQSLYNNDAGNYNTAYGSQSLYSNHLGSNNTALGYNALYKNLVDLNTALGYQSLYSNTYGTQNTATGIYSLYKNIDGNDNTANGSNALKNNINGVGNVAFGSSAMTNNVSGSFNTALGASALLNLLSGNSISGIGNLTAANDGLTNATAIGANAKVEQSNSLILGSIFNINGATANTNVGIGTTTPNAALQFGNTINNRKIVLFDYSNNDNQYYGFGINGSMIRYQVDDVSADHVFYAGVNSMTSNELMRIKGNGNVGIGTAITNNKLTINSTATIPATVTSYPLAIQQAGSTDITLGSNSLALLQTWNSKPLLINGQGNNVGIGLNIAPTAKLDINGALLVEGAQATHAQGAYLEWNKNNGGGSTYLLNQKGLGAGGIIIGEIDNANAITERITIDNAGNVGIGTTLPLLQKFTVVGNGTFSGTVNASCGLLICSDIRYKKDIQPLQNALSKVMQLKGVSYYFRKDEFKEKHFTDDKQVGLIAQEVEKIYPELVQTDAEGYKSIDYSKLTPILVEAIKELKGENEVLKVDNAKLKTSLEKLDFKVDGIEKLMQNMLPVAKR